MATWTSLAVLSLAVVSTLSFPRPDAAYKIPTVGLGSRAQYYVLHSDGSYKYGFDTGDGLYEQSMAQVPGEVTGAFGYKDPTGADIKLEYTADDRGFIARGAHLPVAPEGDFGSRVNEATNAAHTRGAVTSYSAASSLPTSSFAAAAPSDPVEVAEVRSSAGDDGSYSFDYKTSSSSRAESADAHNSVRGQYAFVADDGINREIKYIAGSETGYIAEGDSLPIGPAVPGAESGIPTGRILPILSEEEANALAAASSRSSSAASYVAPSNAVASTKSAATGSSDASYSFNYDAGDSARSETADADLNIEGVYSFVPPGGHRLTVNYVAGSDTGFVATGDHLPVAPDADFGSRTSGQATTSDVAAYSAASSASASASSSAISASAPIEVAQVRSSASDDGSYSFAYDTSSSSRSETADAHNSVSGHYAFVADDGINREIKYIAGSETGYIAEGDSLPRGPPVPGAESGIPTGRILPVLSEKEANALASATSSSSNAVPYAAASPSTSTFSDTSSGAVASTKSATTGSSDASYSFRYDAGDSDRHETADADLNIEGSYSFIPPEGHRLTVHYVAGSDTGFVATGDHLPVAPDADFGSRVTGASAATATNVVPYSAPSVASPSAAVAAAPVELAQVRSSTADDGSYSFSYKTASSSRSESADAHNSVSGQYSFVADDGINREIKYIAGSETGYIAEGDSLPIGPSVPGAESGIPTGRILPILSEEEANALAAASSGSTSTAYAAKTSSTSTFSTGSKTSAFQGAAPSAVVSTKSAPTGSSDASYSFNYDAGDSARSESADADLNIEGTYSFVPPEGHRLTVHYVAGSDTGFVAKGDHLPVAPDADFTSRLSGQATTSGVAAYSAASAAASAATSATSSTAAAYSVPIEVAQIRSSSADDGSYSFAYETGSSSRSESADAQNSVKGRYAFVADDGINREIKYIAGSATGYIAEGDSLPIGPAVPGAESGIPTGRILPVLTEEEANALAATSFSNNISPLLKTSAHSGAAATPADASYSFSFASDSYSRKEEADADGNVVGSYTFLDEDGKEHTVNFVAGRETGFLPEGFPTPAPASASPVDSANALSATSAYSSSSKTGSSSNTHPIATKSVGTSTATKYSSPQGTSSSAGHSSYVVGDVLLHQYDVVNRDKYGYVFTALRR